MLVPLSTPGDHTQAVCLRTTDDGWRRAHCWLAEPRGVKKAHLELSFTFQQSGVHSHSTTLLLTVYLQPFSGYLLHSSLIGMRNRYKSVQAHAGVTQHPILV